MITRVFPPEAAPSDISTPRKTRPRKPRAETGAQPGGPADQPRDPHPATVLQKKDFVDRVVAASGARKADARPIIEATLAQLGQALSAGETLAVPPLGRARVNLERDQRGGEIITLRLRRRPPSPRAATPRPAAGLRPAD